MPNKRKNAGLLLILAALPIFAASCAQARAAAPSGDYTAVAGEVVQAVSVAEEDTTYDRPSVTIDTDDWRLLLVNPWNPIPEDYDTPTLTQLINGQAIDERCYPDLQEMMDDCRAEGLNPLICSSYRTWQTQEELFENRVQRLIAEGYDEETARTEAGTVVAVPGTSEHQLGLAVDIVDISNQNLNERQADTAVQKWLMEHSWEYGWILRYPSGKSEITGIIYEPWHYRYVGREAAGAIYKQGVCLEEYLDAAD